MTTIDVLTDAFDRVRDEVHPAVNGLSTEDLAFRPLGQSNSIGWLVWHLTRIQDDHIADLNGKQQAWITKAWHERFALPIPPTDTGYGHGPDDVAAVKVNADELLDYFEDVHAETMAYIGSLTDDELARVVDTLWDPPVTVAIRLVSILADTLQHVGQAAYVRGLLQH
jgi:uncharacterized damage-inducible protein DinB